MPQGLPTGGGMRCAVRASGCARLFGHLEGVDVNARFGEARGKARAVISAAAIIASMLSGSVSAVADGNGGGNGGGNGPSADHWGVITRNTMGSPVAELRNGPIVPFPTPGVLGATARPPYGTGSLGIAVADSAIELPLRQEKVDFGNEVDFFGDPLLGLNKIGFHVFQTGENVTYGGGRPNMPNIRIEIDPNRTEPDNYSTLVWVPPATSALNSWSPFIDATTSGTWYLTGEETNCKSSSPCSFTNLKASFAGGIAPPTILSIAVGKGRDHMWIGAVDGLRVNRYVYDFEADGVRARRVG
ncbi:hypothetical protein ACFWVC_20410 [Streptomyces sp. NPDC058691]|uniref:hypothetical protein n=1 Tax=Streptomyces sp. NPDC058691 TaxID=3346601 RepID=UPI00364B9108